MTPALAIFDKNLFLFQIFGKFVSCSKFLDLDEPVKLFKAWYIDTG